MTKWQLFQAFTEVGTMAEIVLPGTSEPVRLLAIPVRLLAIEREDGSGSSFNVKVRSHLGGAPWTVHVRTDD